MGKLISQTFLSLDGVMEAPEKWQLPNELFGEDAGAFVFEAYAAADALLLGRVTYPEFASFWPSQADADPFAKRINAIPRYVVSKTLKTLNWKGSHQIKGNVTDEVRKLKEQAGGNILLVGSAKLTNSLTKDGLIDEYQVLLHPILVGRGKHLFQEGVDPTLLALADTRTFATGVIALTYRPKGKAKLT